MILNLIIAFGGGLISFLSPCVLPLIPGYISYISGQSLNDIVEQRKKVLSKTILFSLGFSLVFIFLVPPPHLSEICYWNTQIHSEL